MATLRSARKRRPTYKTTWAYRKKKPKYRALRLVLEVRKSDSLVFKEILDGGQLEPINLPNGKYEARIVPHPDPQKAEDRTKRWIVVKLGNKIIGSAKNYLTSGGNSDRVKFYAERSTADGNGKLAKAAPQVVTRA